MSRRRRIVIPGEIHHVMARGLNGMEIFADGHDKERFLASLGKYLNQFDNRCYAWALMDNHYHLMLRISGANLGLMMRRLNGSYAQYFNKRHQRRGYVFMDRYKSVAAQENGYFKELIRYIHLNPIRSGAVKDLRRLGVYPWCSHIDYVGTPRHDWCLVREGLAEFGRLRSMRMDEYLVFLADGLKEESFALDPITSPFMRQEDGDDRVVGDGEFVSAALRAEKDRRAHIEQLRGKGIGISQVAVQVCRHLGLEPADIMKQARSNPRAAARSIVAYLAREHLALSLREIGDYLGITETGATLAAQRGKGEYERVGLNINI